MHQDTHFFRAEPLPVHLSQRFLDGRATVVLEGFHERRQQANHALAALAPDAPDQNPAAIGQEADSADPPLGNQASPGAAARAILRDGQLAAGERLAVLFDVASGKR